MATSAPVLQTVTPSSGDTVQILNSDANSMLVLVPAANLAALTLSFPTVPHNGQTLSVVSAKDIAALTLTGGTFSMSPTQVFALQRMAYVYEAASSTWWLTEDEGGADKVIPRVWQGGVQKTMVKTVNVSGTVSGGSVVFSLTDSGGNLIFQNGPYQESANFWVNDASLVYMFGGYTLSGDKKTLTFTVNKLGTAVLGIIQVVSAAANGTVCYLQISGN